MKHELWTQLLSDHFDGALAPEQNARVVGHLAECPACRDELALYRRADAAMRECAARAGSACEPFVRSVMLRLSPNDDGPLSRLLAGPAFAVPAFAFCLAILAVLLHPAASPADPIAALMIAQDGGATYSWLSTPAPSAAAYALGEELR